ncbi:class A beta-lactamase [Sphingobium aquiterrae]|uniref:class A beta-lactamase n=1 Tax=Sphingobium aquiterrae TaxID=2038656 RepID=UPI0030190187
MHPFKTVARSLLPFLLFAAPFPAADAFGPADVPVRQQTADARLKAEFARFAALSDGSVGIAAQRIMPDGSLDPRVVTLNGDTLFPMASSYKIAVAGTILSQVDKGTVSLDTLLPVNPAIVVPSSGIAEQMPHRGVVLSVHNLLELMLTRSDNTATDVLVAKAGGPQVVNGWLRSIGIKGQRVDSNTADLLYRAMGLSPEALHKDGRTPGQIMDAAMAADSELQQRDARDLPNIAFANDPRDTSTPMAMAQLLVAIRTGKALKPQSTATLLDIMTRCHTGAARLKGMLPPDTPVAHKTGSLNGTGVDAGIVTLPDGSLMAIAAFVMKDSKGHVSRDRIMAEAARAAFDYYLFTTA